MWINFTFHHMTDVEKSEISFNMCTNYGIFLHFTLFCFKKLVFLQFTLFFAKLVCCNLRAIVWRKFWPKKCPWRKNDKYEVCHHHHHDPVDHHTHHHSHVDCQTDEYDPAQVWAQVHHNRPIPDHLLQAALKALDVAPVKIESVPRISSVLIET